MANIQLSGLEEKSLQFHFGEFEVFLELFILVIVVIALTEKWLEDSDNNDDLNFQRYHPRESKCHQKPEKGLGVSARTSK